MSINELAALAATGERPAAVPPLPLTEAGTALEIDRAVGTPLRPTAAPPGSVAPAHVAPGSCHLVDGRADTKCTPGALNPDVTQATIGCTNCVSGQSMWRDYKLVCLVCLVLW